MSVKPDCHPEASNTGREALTLRAYEGSPDEVAGFFVAAGYATLAMRAPQNDILFLIFMTLLTLRPGDGREMNKSEIKDKDKNIDKEKSHENSWQIYK